MTEERYKKMMALLSSRRIYVALINNIDRAITIIIFLSYVLAVVYTFFKMPKLLIPLVAVPGVSFVALSLFRRRYDAARPYEVYATQPVLKKDTSGKSFPSRHIFSVFVIGTTFMVLAVNYASPAGVAIAAVMMVMGLLQAVLRVIGGVHFIRDVIVGALIGILAGIVGVIFIISP